MSVSARDGDEQPRVRPRATHRVNGAALAPLHPRPRSGDPDPDDLAAWQAGAAALARLPASTRLPMLEHLEEERRRALREVHATHERLERLRWWPEAAIDTDIGERLGAEVLISIPAHAPPALRLERLDPEGHTILYGTGGAGKGTLTADWIRRLAGDGERVLVVDFEGHPREWSRRLTGLGAGNDARQVLHVAPFASTWSGRRGAIWDIAAQLRGLAVAWEATYVVIDSIVPACGSTDPLKPEAAGQYAAALEQIGLPALSLAHVTKAEQLGYPFGSVFWHNLARLTWSLQVDGQRAILANRKSNNYSRGGRYVVSVTWRDGMPVEVWERPFVAVLADRVADVLTDGALSVEGIVRALNVDLEEGEIEVRPDSVRAALRRNAKGEQRRFDIDGGLWSLRP